MILVALLVGLLCVARLARSAGMLSPATVFAGTAWMTLLTFQLMYRGGFVPDVLIGFWGVEGDYSTQMPQIAVAYMFLCAVALVADLAASRTRAKSTPSISSEDVLRWLRRYFASEPSVLVLLVCCFLALVHFLDVDWHHFFRHSEYLFTRNPRNVGISNPLAYALHVGIAPISVLVSPWPIVFIRARRFDLAVLSCLLVGYLMFVQISGGSRAAAAQAVVLALAAQVSSRRKLSIGLVVFFALAIVLYAAALESRRLQVLGAVVMFQRMLDGEVFFTGWFFLLIYTLFGGAFVLAEALGQDTLAYPFAYKSLSFSPLVSAVDGFAGVQNAEHRVNLYVPFNNLAELFHFGFLYALLYAVFIFAALWRMQVFWRSQPRFLGFLMAAPVYAASLNMHFYPVRHSFRLFFYGAVATFVVERVVRPSRRRTSKTVHPSARSTPDRP